MSERKGGGERRPAAIHAPFAPNATAAGILATKFDGSPPAPYNARRTVSYAVAKACKKLKPPSAPRLPSVKAPGAAVELEWAYGVSSKAGCYSAVANDIVYAVGAVGVLYSPQWNEQRHFSGHAERIAALAVSADGSLVATATLRLDTPVLLWNPRTLRERARCYVAWPESEVTVHVVQRLAFAPDGGSLICCFRSGVCGTGIVVWDAATGAYRAHFSSREMDLRSAIAVDECCVAFSPRRVHMWEVPRAAAAGSALIRLAGMSEQHSMRIVVCAPPS